MIASGECGSRIREDVPAGTQDVSELSPNADAQ